MLGKVEVMKMVELSIFVETAPGILALIATVIPLLIIMFCAVTRWYHPILTPLTIIIFIIGLIMMAAVAGLLGEIPWFNPGEVTAPEPP